MKTTITKSLLAAALALGFGTAALAQARQITITAPYTETFESCSGGDLPPGWKLIDDDGDGRNWQTNNFIDDPACGHNDSQRCAMSRSWAPGTNVSPNNVLITPKLIAVKSIRYWVSASDKTSFAEYYEVRACSSENQDATQGWTKIFSETLTAEAGANGVDDNSKYQYREINLPPGTRYVAFLHKSCMNEFVLRIDNISFSNIDIPGSPDPVTLPYTETFESCSGGSLPPDWRIVDLDGDGRNWYTHEDSSPAGHNDSQRCAMSRSWVFGAGDLTPRNHLISPNVTGVKSISYWVSASNPTDFAEHYEVWIGRGDNQETDEMIFEETLTAEAAANGVTDNSKYQYREMNVPAGTKYVSFYHRGCTGQYILRIDDITFSDKVIGGTEPVTLPYTETFESCSGGALPAGWKADDLDGDGYTWKTNNFDGAPNCGLNDSHNCAWSASGGWGNVSNIKNELISPKVTGVKSISYWVSASDLTDFAEHYTVFVGFGDNQETETKIFSETLTAEAAANGVIDNSKYQYREMNVPAGTKYISFYHVVNGSQCALRIDDITFSDKPTSTQDIEAEQLRLYAKDGELCIDTPTAGARVNVFALDGRRVADQPSVAGLNTIALARGYYVVQVGSFTGKVYVP